MTIQRVSIELIDPNPHPMWQLNQDWVAELHEQFKARGFKDVLTGRPSSATPGRFELRAGQHRLLALHGLIEEIDLNVHDFTDEEMREGAIIENFWRRNPNPIETAHAIAAYKKDHPHATNDETAVLFNLKTGAAVSNLIAMLKLPPVTQAFVSSGKLAQRNARALLTVQRLDANAVDKIAEASLSAENTEEFIDARVEDLIQKKGQRLAEAPWNLSWPERPMQVDGLVNAEYFIKGQSRGGITEIPACQSCPFFFVRHTDAYCGNADCFKMKLELKLPDALKKASRKLGIAAAGPDEKAQRLFAGGDDWQRERQIDAIIAEQRPELRLLPYPVLDNNRNGFFDRRNRLGSPYIALGTIDKKASEDWMNKPGTERTEQRKVEKTATKENETEKQRAQRIAEEEQEEKRRRKTRSAENKNKHQVLWLIENASKLIAERIVIQGEITRFVEELVIHRWSIHAGAMARHDEDLEQRIKKAATDEAEALRRERLVYRVLAQDVNQHYGSDEAPHYVSLGKVHQQIERLLGTNRKDEFGDYVAGFGVKLPNSWDSIPVLQTAFNCWHCGQFAPGEKITKRDQAEGWIDFGDKGIFCNGGHRSAFEKANKKSAKITNPAKPVRDSSPAIRSGKGRK